MHSGPDVSAFPPEYAARVASAFMLVDDLLARATHSLDPAVLDSPFSIYLTDVVPVHQQLLADHAKHIRQVMGAMVKQHRMPLPERTVSARQACRMLVNEALIEVGELDPRGSHAHAGLSDELREDASRIVDHIMELLQVLEEDLVDVGGAAQVGQDDRSATTELQRALLREMKRVVVAHRLAHFDASVDVLLERTDTQDVEIGVFGAVSTGKSSLLNNILGAPILPVSAMPTTVVPVHLSYRVQERGRVEFADGKPELFVSGRLAEFVSMRFNPRNVRHVTRILMETPAAALKCGVTLIDMPGVLFQATGPESIAGDQLRRCDLAIVLISAAAALTLEEAKLIKALHRVGTDVMVLVTKIDLVASDDRWRIYDYVVRELWQRTRLDLPVYLVSTREADAAPCRAWIDGPLAEYVDQYRGRRHALLHRKIDILRHSLIDVLEQQLSRSDWPKFTATELSNVKNRLFDVLTTLEEANFRQFNPTEDAGRQTTALIDEVAHNAAVLWSETHDSSFDITRLIELAATARAHGAAMLTSNNIEKIRAQASVALAKAGHALGRESAAPMSLPLTMTPPPFTCADCMVQTVLPRSMGALLGRWGFYLSARHHLARAPAIAVIDDALEKYFISLNDWSATCLSVLIQTFIEQRDRLIGNLDSPSDRESSVRIAWVAELKRDIQILQQYDPSRPHQAK